MPSVETGTRSVGWLPDNVRGSGVLEGWARRRADIPLSADSTEMLLASMAVNEFPARLHHFRDDGNATFAVNRISLTQAQAYYEADGAPCPALARLVGRGDVSPLLEMPELSEVEEVEAGADERAA